MVARQPLRVQQGQRTGLRRDDLVHAEDAMGHVGGIHVDLHGAFERHIARRWHIGESREGADPEGSGGEG